ncbi:acyl carrier protein [Streptacidiphilus sp. PAMC 29251]
MTDVRAIRENPYFSGIYRVSPAGETIAAVSVSSFMSVPEVRYRLGSLLGVDVHSLVFAAFFLDEDFGPDVIRDESVAAGEFHRTVAPVGDVESQLVERVVLMLPEDSVVSTADSIWHLGGDSLFCLELSEAITEAWAVELDPVEIFRSKSLAQLATDIESNR